MRSTTRCQRENRGRAFLIGRYPLRGLVMTVLVLLGSGPGDSSRESSDRAPATVGTSLPEPPPGPRPLQVHLGLTIVDFARINSREETFDVRGYLEITWNDPRHRRRDLTLIDRHAFLSFLFAFLDIVAVAWLHIRFRHRGLGTAGRHQRLLRGLFPIVYVVALAITYRSA